MKKILLLIALSIYSFGAFSQNKFINYDNTNFDATLGATADDNLRTIECWFKLNTQITPSLVQIQTLMYRPNTGNTDAFGLYFGQSNSTGAEGRLIFVRRVGSSYNKCVSDSNTWAPGIWHHVAGVIDPTTGMKLYIDGVLQTSTHPSNTETTSSSTVLHLGSYGNSQRGFKGQIDNVGLWTRALQQSEVQNHASLLCYSFDPNAQNGLRAFYNFETDGASTSIVNDVSPNGINGNRNTSATSILTGACYNPNPSVGQNFSAGINNVSKIDLGGTVGNGVRSVECWFKLNQPINSSLPQSKTLIYRNSGSGDEDYGLFFGAYNWTGRKGRLVFNRSGGNSLHYVVSDNNSWAANVWHHVVGVIDPTTGMALYIDGVKQASTIPNSKFAVNTKTTSTQIGAWGSNTTRYFDGNIDGVRLWNRALTPTEIDLNMCGFDPSATQTGLVAHYDFDGSIYTWLDDKSGNNNNASTIILRATQDAGQSCYKANTSSTASTLQINGAGAHGKLSLNSADNLRSIECWFKLDDPIDNTLATTQTLIIKPNSNGHRDFGLFFGQSSWTGREGKLVFVRRIGSLNHYIVSNSDTWAVGIWHHVAGVIDPTNGMELYIDGVKQTDTHSSTAVSQHEAGAYNPTVGVWGQSGRYFKGLIDEVRFWTRALTVAEINANNCNNFNPSIQTGLTGYWNFDQSTGVNPSINIAGSSNTMNLLNGAIRVSGNACGNTPSVAAVDVVSTCDGLPYQWLDGSFYSTDISSGVFHTIIGGAANGSDSIIELQLTIAEPGTSIDIQTACGSYQWIDGVTYSANNNTATHTLVAGAASGCDSIVTLNLIINTNETTTQVVSACGGYTWINGTTYNASNTTATHTVNGATASGCDSIYYLNLTINNNESATQTIVACNSYTWVNGTTYNASNNTDTHVVVGATANGCDSIYYLDLTINNDIHTTDVITACDIYTWRNGTQYFSSVNVYANTIVVAGATATGCDSIYHLDLTINNNIDFNDTIIACGSYTWRNGATYNATNLVHWIYQVPGATATGCDSNYVLYLTINNPTTSIDVQSACSSYTWIDGVTYSANNSTATHTLVGGNADGCDSTVTLNLTINNNEAATQTIVACGSYTWLDGINYTSNNTTATHTISGATANGCDSIYTLDLTINNNETGVATITACGSYTWLDGVTYTSSNNTAMHTVNGVTANGCDSVYTLDLTINSNEVTAQTITACISYIWLDGVTYSSSNNTATHTVYGVTANGCDSVYTLDLTVNNNETATQTIAACDSYTWIDGVTYTASNNTATHIVAGAAVTGCDSVYTLDLTLTVVDNLTSINGIEITANAVGSTYQWVDCNNGNVNLIGETNASYTPTVNGNYAVEVTTNSCVETSACVVINNVGIEDIIGQDAIKLFPNPTTGKVTIVSSQEIETIEILNLSGQTIAVFNATNTIDISRFTKGVYFARIKMNNNHSAMLKLVKQ